MRRGPYGRPTLFHAAWNDGQAVFRDEASKSVILGLQLVYAANLLRPCVEERAHRTALRAKMDEEMTRV